ncbi:hypothetical protein AWENTII_012137 [Aspergillus wentii]
MTTVREVFHEFSSNGPRLVHHYRELVVGQLLPSRIFTNRNRLLVQPSGTDVRENEFVSGHGTLCMVGNATVGALPIVTAVDRGNWVIGASRILVVRSSFFRVPV